MFLLLIVTGLLTQGEATTALLISRILCAFYTSIKYKKVYSCECYPQLIAVSHIYWDFFFSVAAILFL